MVFGCCCGPLLGFAVRWGDVLAAPASLLHSPELFVPLVVRELNLLLPSSSNVSYKVVFLKPRGSLAPGASSITPEPGRPLRGSEEPNTPKPYVSNCVAIADNLALFLKGAGLATSTAKIEDHFSGKLPVNENTVYVFMIETKEDLDAWVLSRDSSRSPLRLEQIVLVTTDRFFARHRRELAHWLVIEISETGANYGLTATGTSSELGLASQIINAISMRLVGMLSSRGKRARAAAARAKDGSSSPPASPRGAAAWSDVGSSHGGRSPPAAATPRPLAASPVSPPPRSTARGGSSAAATPRP